MNNQHIIIVLSIIVILLIFGIGYSFLNTPQDTNSTFNNTSNSVNASSISTDEVPSYSSASGEYGYCAICGSPLTASEASNEYTQGKVCLSCAKNPYYYTEEGSAYANQKLDEMYPSDDGSYNSTS